MQTWAASHGGEVPCGGVEYRQRENEPTEGSTASDHIIRMAANELSVLQQQGVRALTSYTSSGSKIESGGRHWANSCRRVF